MMGSLITVVELGLLYTEFSLATPAFIVQVIMINLAGSVLTTFLRRSFDFLYDAHERRRKELVDLHKLMIELVIDYAREMREISGKIRLPANLMVMTVSLLKAEEGERLSLEGVSALEKMEQNITEIMKLADDIQHNAEALTERNGLEIESFSLSDLIHDLIDDYAQVAKRKNLRLRCVLDPFLPDELNGYPGTLLYVMRKLVATMIFFTSEGEVNIGVRQGEQGWWMLQINNEGRGNRHPAFYQILTADSAGEQANGFLPDECRRGLRLVRELVVSMGGSIRVEPQHENGPSHIIVDLPMSPTSLGGIPVFNDA
jgi:signal transduction histidine kinase